MERAQEPPHHWLAGMPRSTPGPLQAGPWGMRWGCARRRLPGSQGHPQVDRRRRLHRQAYRGRGGTACQLLNVTVPLTMPVCWPSTASIASKQRSQPARQQASEACDPPAATSPVSPFAKMLPELPPRKTEMRPPTRSAKLKIKIEF